MLKILLLPLCLAVQIAGQTTVPAQASSAPAQTKSVSPQANSAAADFPQMGRYRAENAALSTSHERVRVLFLGDSITDYWGKRAGKWFAHTGWINRGIGGQTTAQMLLREQDDALAFEPEAIVLEGGANDMRLGFTPVEIRDRVRSMGELAALHHAKIFVAAMTPVCDCFRQLTGLRTPQRIAELNTLLRDLCAEKHWTFVNASDVLKDADGLMRKDLTWDGVHPNDAGYARMAPVYESALANFR